MMSPYRVRSAMTGGRGMRMGPSVSPAAAMAGGAAGAGAVAALTGTAPPVAQRRAWARPSMPGAPGSPGPGRAVERRGRRERTADMGNTAEMDAMARLDRTVSDRHADAPSRDNTPAPRASPTTPSTAQQRSPVPSQRSSRHEGNPTLGGWDPQMQLDPSRPAQDAPAQTASGLHVPASYREPPPPAPPSDHDDTDYDPEDYQRRWADAARTGGQAAKFGAGFVRRHALLTYAAAGVALTGVGIPAAAAVYLGGKAMKTVTRGPRSAAVRAAQNVVTSNRQRWQALRDGQTNSQHRFNTLAGRGQRIAPKDTP